MKSDKPLFPQLFKGIALFTPGGDLIYGIDPSKQSHWHMHLCAGLQEILGLQEPPHFLVPGYTASIDRWLDPHTQQLRTSAEIYRPVLHHQALLSAVFGISNLVWQVAPWQDGSCDPIVLETYRHQFPQLWEDHDLIVRFDRTQAFSYSFRDSRVTLPFRQQEPLRGTGMPFPKEGLLFPTRHEPLWGTGTSTGYGEPLTTNADADDFTRENVGGGAPPQLPLSAAHNSSEENLPHSYSQPPRAQGYVLRLFVSGNNAATEQTLKSLHQLLEHSLGHPYTLKVIDVFNHPDQAEVNQISATPTLLRVWPEPIRRIVGDLNDLERVLRVLGVPEP